MFEPPSVVSIQEQPTDFILFDPPSLVQPEKEKESSMVVTFFEPLSVVSVQVQPTNFIMFDPPSLVRLQEDFSMTVTLFGPPSVVPSAIAAKEAFLPLPVVRANAMRYNPCLFANAARGGT